MESRGRWDSLEICSSQTFLRFMVFPRLRRITLLIFDIRRTIICIYSKMSSPDTHRGTQNGRCNTQTHQFLTEKQMAAKADIWQRNLNIDQHILWQSHPSNRHKRTLNHTRMYARTSADTQKHIWMNTEEQTDADKYQQEKETKELISTDKQTVADMQLFI